MYPGKETVRTRAACCRLSSNWARADHVLHDLPPDGDCCRNAAATTAFYGRGVMDGRPPATDPSAAGDVASVEFRLFVWTSPSLGWRARITGVDDFEREFTSPFELARFVAWPVANATGKRGPGLR